jgi:predicted nucleic acid-binding protein
MTKQEKTDSFLYEEDEDGEADFASDSFGKSGKPVILSYFDSSCLLSILLEEKRAEEANQYWKNARRRCSSILFRIEPLISIRRYYELPKFKAIPGWLGTRLELLNIYLSRIDCRNVGNQIRQKIVHEKKLARCRTLDAIHVATALVYREIESVDDVYFYTFDDRMKELAESFGFRVNPEASSQNILEAALPR